MTPDELMKDSENFRDKDGFGYIHAELANKNECMIYLAGHGAAIETIVAEMIKKLAHEMGMPVPALLTKFLLLTICDDSNDDSDGEEDDDTLTIVESGKPNKTNTQDKADTPDNPDTTDTPDNPEGPEE